MLFPLSEKGMNKQAFDLVGELGNALHFAQHFDPHIIRHTITGTMIGGAQEGTKRLFARRGANLLNKGIEMGKANQKMSPFTETMTNNLLGKSVMKPYHEGLQVGNQIREKGLNPEEELHHISGIVDQKMAEKEQLLQAGKKVKDPVIKAYDNFQTGAYHHNHLFNSMIGAKPISQESNGMTGKVVANALSLPAAVYVDPMAVVRPTLSKAESMPKVNDKLHTLFPENTKREKVYSKVRNFID
jgi:hypothetical protein